MTKEERKHKSEQYLIVLFILRLISTHSCSRPSVCLFVCLFISSLIWDSQSETMQVASVLSSGPGFTKITLY